MTIEERIKEIEGRLEVADRFALIPNEDGPTVSDYYAHDVKYLLSELKRSREALMSVQYHYSCLESRYLQDGNNIGLTAMSHPKKLVDQALHPEGVK